MSVVTLNILRTSDADYQLKMMENAAPKMRLTPL